MGITTAIYRSILAAALLLLPAQASRAAAGVQTSFQYMLCSFSGKVGSMWAILAVDRQRNEIFTLDREQRQVRIFDQYGMQVHDFGEDVNLSGAVDLALGDDGEIYVLFGNQAEQPLLRLDYKGEPLGPVALREIPASFQPFTPDHLDFQQGRLYLADSEGLKIIVTDSQGRFQQGYDIAAMLAALAEQFEGRDKEKTDTGIAMGGFSVDGRGDMYFTIPVLFAAFRMSAAGELQGFGTPGSSPGKFGVVAGIQADDQGNIFVADRLRSVVFVFDRSFKFITEFGYRGSKPSSLIVPDDVVIDGQGYVYVSQAANRGVSVFKVVYE